MRKITNCFFATTPYQIITAVNLAINSGKSSDLYIFDQFSSAYEVAEKVRKTGLFEKVKVLDNDSTYSRFSSGAKSRKIETLRFLLALFRCHKIASDVFDPDDVYEIMYASVPNLYYRILQLHLNKYRTKMYMYDDGLGSYYSPLIVKKRKIDLLVQKIFFRRDLFKESVKLLYSPQLYWHLQQDDSTVEKIPNMYTDAKYRQMLVDIFGISEFSEPVIIIDTVKDLAIANEEAEKMESAYQYVYDTLGAERVICKRHPRDNSPKEADKKYMDNSIPFETTLLQNSMADKVFITVDSTAALNAKLLFEQEPIIIVMVNLFEYCFKTGNRFLDLCKYVKSTYSDPSRFCLVESEQEFRDVIDRLKGKMDRKE